MKRNIPPIFVFVFGAFVLLGGIFYFYNVSAQTGSITATVVIGGVCGNGIIESGEQCDNGGSNGACPAACSTSCTTNSCVSPPPSGGGGGGGAWVAPTTQVILQGIAHPKAEITVLKDGQVATGIIADSLANFKVTLTTLTAGTYTFGLWAEDKDGRRSITFSFTVTVTSGMTTTIGGIFIPPTIELEKTRVDKGEALNILGQTVPQSEVTVHIESPEALVKKTTSTVEGDWNYSLDTAILEEGTHITKAKAVSSGGLISTYSNALMFVVGSKGIVSGTKKGEINGDGRVNLVDFSILLYNWGVPKNPAADLNADGKVNLVDFSIMLYWWTG